jgi:hypothetical protein
MLFMIDLRLARAELPGDAEIHGAAERSRLDADEVMGFEGINPFDLLFFPWSCVNVVTLRRRMSASRPFVDHNHFWIHVCVVRGIRWVLIGSRGRISLIVPDI